MQPRLFLLLLLLLGSIVSIGQYSNNTDPVAIKTRMFNVALWQLQHSNGKPLNTWTNAAFYTGVFATYQSTKNIEILDSLFAMGERTKWLPGRRYDHADDYAIGQLYLDLFQIKQDDKMLQPTYDSLKKMQLTPGNEIKKHGINWWWCDALFMAPPTMAKMAKVKQDESLLILSDTLFRQAYQLLYHQDDHLFARDAVYLWSSEGEGRKESNGKRIFWSRGNGWVLAGLARYLDAMPKNYAGRQFYLNLYQSICLRIIELQQPDGLWRTSLLDPEAYLGGEASGTGFICYALAWGVNQKIIDRKTFLPMIKKAWDGLNLMVTPENKVGWVQPIGADPRKNFNSESWESFGTGAYLLAASEILKIKQIVK